MMGRVFDRFVQSSEADAYLKERTSIGAGTLFKYCNLLQHTAVTFYMHTGYTRKTYGGHTSVPTDPSMDGYHGKEGYRRNTPDLRRRRSVFDYEGVQLIMSVRIH